MLTEAYSVVLVHYKSRGYHVDVLGAKSRMAVCKIILLIWKSLLGAPGSARCAAVTILDYSI